MQTKFQVLIIFSNKPHWIDFRLAEFKALLSLYGEKYDLPTDCVLDPENPYLIIKLQSLDTITKICERAVTIVKIIHLWGYGENDDKNEYGLKHLIDSLDYNSINEYNKESISFCLSVESYGLSIDTTQQSILRNQILTNLQLKGSIKLKEMDMRMTLQVHFYKIHEDNTDIMPKRYYFGRIIAETRMKDGIKLMDVKQRGYIGPTTLDHNLSFLMNNIAQVNGKNSIVYDPFVGTASILLAAAWFGAMTYGADIDIRVLTGNMYAGQSRDKDPDSAFSRNINSKNVPRDVFGNFDAFQLPRPELIRMDNHMSDRNMNLPVTFGFFDAIVTDPPYSIRAGARKSGRKGGARVTHENIQKSKDYVPPTQPYQVEEVMLDLLHSAAIQLRPGGRLVYLIPVPYDLNPLKELPTHPCMEYECSSLQKLSSRYGRLLVCMKRSESLLYDEATKKKYDEYRSIILQDAVIATKMMKEAQSNVEEIQKALDMKGKIADETALPYIPTSSLPAGFASVMVRLEMALAVDAMQNNQVKKVLSSRHKKRINRKEQQKNAIKSNDKET